MGAGQGTKGVCCEVGGLLRGGGSLWALVSLIRDRGCQAAWSDPLHSQA